MKQVACENCNMANHEHYCACQCHLPPSPKETKSWNSWREGVVIALKCVIAPYSVDFATKWSEFTINNALESIEAYTQNILAEESAKERERIKATIVNLSLPPYPHPIQDIHWASTQAWLDAKNDILTALEEPTN